MTNRGIDYSLGLSNRDKSTGIHYGCISQNSILEYWAEESEGQYGDATCGYCGNTMLPCDNEAIPDLDDSPEGWEDNGRDYACLTCKKSFDSDESFPDEPIGYTLNDGTYTAEDCLDSDVILTKSPYYTLAPYCSPCVPGAGDLNNAEDCTEGIKAYCFGHECFDEGRAPYPVYRVADNSSVEPE
jgi:hypothetical protein